MSVFAIENTWNFFLIAKSWNFCILYHMAIAKGSWSLNTDLFVS